MKTLTEFDFSFQPCLRREQIDSLHELGFLERRYNVVFLGPPGVGMRHLAISIAVAASESGRRINFGPLGDLIDSLDEVHAAGTAQTEAQEADAPGTAGGGRDRLPLGHGERSEAVLPADQQPLRTRVDGGDVEQGFEDWGDILHNEVMAAALLDRLLYRCHFVNIRGNGYRMRRHEDLSAVIHPTALMAVDAEQAQIRQTL